MKKPEIYAHLKGHPDKIRFDYLCRAAEQSRVYLPLE
jgi:hypothetical protein